MIDRFRFWLAFLIMPRGSARDLAMRSYRDFRYERSARELWDFLEQKRAELSAKYPESLFKATYGEYGKMVAFAWVDDPDFFEPSSILSGVLSGVPAGKTVLVPVPAEPSE